MSRMTVKTKSMARAVPFLVALCPGLLLGALAAEVSEQDVKAAVALVAAFRKFDTSGARLTPQGWRRSARYLVNPLPRPPQHVMYVTVGEQFDNTERVGSTVRVWRELLWIGQVDWLARFTRQVEPPVVGKDNRPYKPPPGDEAVKGPMHIVAAFDVSVVTTFREFAPGTWNLREVRGKPEWRIANVAHIPWVPYDTAIQYLTRLTRESGDERIRMNAAKSIQGIRATLKHQRIRMVLENERKMEREKRQQRASEPSSKVKRTP